MVTLLLSLLMVKDIEEEEDCDEDEDEDEENILLFYKLINFVVSCLLIDSVLASTVVRIRLILTYGSRDYIDAWLSLSRSQLIVLSNL